MFLLVLLLALLSDTVPVVPANASIVHEGHTVALLHMHDRAWFFSRLGNLTGENKLRYANRFGYDFVSSVPSGNRGIYRETRCDSAAEHVADGKCWTSDHDFEIDHSRAATFGKVKLALAACNAREHGWLLWTDADAMVVNQSVPLETIIDDGYDLIFAYDWLVCASHALSFHMGIGERHEDRLRFYVICVLTLR